MSLRRSIVAVVGALALSLLASVGSANAGAPTTRGLLVPGQYVGAVPYAQMADALARADFPATVLDLAGTDLSSDARVISAEVDKLRRTHPNDRVAIVGHSIGGMSGRLYLSSMAGHEKVATYVSIGSPPYGSPGACGQAAAEVCPSTSLMKDINVGDDTPGETRYFGIRSAREWVDGHLDGGQCRVTPVPANESLPVLGLEHFAVNSETFSSA